MQWTRWGLLLLLEGILRSLMPLSALNHNVVHYILVNQYKFDYIVFIWFSSFYNYVFKMDVHIHIISETVLWPYEHLMLYLVYIFYSMWFKRIKNSMYLISILVVIFYNELFNQEDSGQTVKSIPRGLQWNGSRLRYYYYCVVTYKKGRKGFPFHWILILLVEQTYKNSLPNHIMYTYFVFLSIGA